MGNNAKLFHHPTFGTLDYDHPFMVLKAPIHSSRDMRNWNLRLEQIRHIDTSNLLMPLKTEVEEGSACDHMSFVKIWLKDYPLSLKSQIQQRKQKLTFFAQYQIFKVLRVLLQAARQFESANLKVGDIQPAYVLINQQGDISLFSVFSEPNGLTNFQKCYNKQVQGYLAPQELVQLKLKNYFPLLDNHLAECFSIGLTILDMATLESSQSFYSYTFFNQTALRQSLDRVQKKYGIFLRTILQSLTQIEAKHRSRATQILDLLHSKGDLSQELSQTNID